MKKSTLLILILLIIVILMLTFLVYYYNKFYKFYRNLYYDECYVNKNRLKYLKNVKVQYINNPLFQTYHNKNKIPSDIYENVKKYAPDYTHIIMDDNDIKNFLKTYYNDIVLQTFNSLKIGAHKADLARYCLLYIYGGLYMDIKVELIKPLRDIFNKGDDIFYSVESNFADHIHQAVIKSPKNNEIFLSLIDYIVKTGNPLFYIDFCRDLYIQILSDTNKIKTGFLAGNKKYYLLKEKCSSTDKSVCYDGFDRYGLCCFIWDDKEPVIKSRRSSYPWK
jgi:mannosyltransferase OCH1-like enzyme